MKTTTKPLLELTAEDLMNRDVVMLPQQMSLRAAAHLLAQEKISGAPVVDEQGRCIGVLSTSDLVDWMDRGPQASKHRFNSNLCVCSDWQVVDLDVLPLDEVSRHMTTDVVKAATYTPIGELARHMIDAHIHRIIVTDDLDRPIGIVSSTDILAAVAQSDRRAARGADDLPLDW
jgi:CBS-domain-containing membrane protein